MPGRGVASRGKGVVGGVTPPILHEFVDKSSVSVKNPLFLGKVVYQ